jgi:hypothetical protein
MTIPIPTLRIGKQHRGKRFDQVPEAYLRGLLKMPGLWQETRDQIEFYLKDKPRVASKAAVPKKDKLEHRPQYFKKDPPPPERSESGRDRFRELAQQAKEKAGYV